MDELYNIIFDDDIPVKRWAIVHCVPAFVRQVAHGRQYPLGVLHAVFPVTLKNNKHYEEVGCELLINKHFMCKVCEDSNTVLLLLLYDIRLLLAIAM